MRNRATTNFGEGCKLETMPELDLTIGLTLTNVYLMLADVAPTPILTLF